MFGARQPSGPEIWDIVLILTIAEIAFFVLFGMSWSYDSALLGLIPPLGGIGLLAFVAWQTRSWAFESGLVAVIAVTAALAFGLFAAWAVTLAFFGIDTLYV